MTPVQELFEKLWDADKDKFVWNAILKEILEKEKEVMCAESCFNKTFKTKER